MVQVEFKVISFGEIKEANMVSSFFRKFALKLNARLNINFQGMLVFQTFQTRLWFSDSLISISFPILSCVQLLF